VLQEAISWYAFAAELTDALHSVVADELAVTG